VWTGRHRQPHYTPRVGKRVLVVDHALPTPDRDAGSACTRSHLQILTGAGFDVTFVAPETSPHDPYARALSDLGIAVPEVRDGEDLRDAVERLAPRCDVVLLYRAPLADRVLDRLREVASSTKVIFLPVDLHHVRMAREAAIGLWDTAPSAEMRSLELDLVRRADATVVVSTVEQELLEEAVPGTKVHTVPILRETPPAGRRADVHVPPSRRRDIVFLGGFAHSPNVDAVHWFVAEVLPRVRAAGVHDRFVVAGYGAPESFSALAQDDVLVAGHVPDLADVFATARMSVVPLRIGAGFKGKIVSSFSFGVPVVTTSVGAEGGGLVDGYDVLIADEPDALAAHIVRLSRDDKVWQRMSEAAYETFRTRFSLESGGSKLVSIVSGLADPGR